MPQSTERIILLLHISSILSYKTYKVFGSGTAATRGAGDRPARDGYHPMAFIHFTGAMAK